MSAVNINRILYLSATFCVEVTLCCCENNKFAFIESICAFDMIWVQDGCYSTFVSVGWTNSIVLHENYEVAWQVGKPGTLNRSCTVKLKFVFKFKSDKLLIFIRMLYAISIMHFYLFAEFFSRECCNSLCVCGSAAQSVSLTHVAGN